MSLRKIDPEQSNVLDGTVYVYEAIPGEGVNVTVAGRDGQVYIVVFDMKDLGIIHKAATAAHEATSDSNPDDLTRITRRGMPYLADLIGVELEKS